MTAKSEDISHAIAPRALNREAIVLDGLDAGERRLRRWQGRGGLSP
ncbi:MAG: hypothetical protein HQ481_10140 [Alphaproteobacteria bacterium]|nr:hypothetical protein [Alphaproteobacteria bacterium]